MKGINEYFKALRKPVCISLIGAISTLSPLEVFAAQNQSRVDSVKVYDSKFGSLQYSSPGDTLPELTLYGVPVIADSTRHDFTVPGSTTHIGPFPKGYNPLKPHQRSESLTDKWGRFIDGIFDKDKEQTINPKEVRVTPYVPLHPSVPQPTAETNKVTTSQKPTTTTKPSKSSVLSQTRDEQEALILAWDDHSFMDSSGPIVERSYTLFPNEIFDTTEIPVTINGIVYSDNTQLPQGYKFEVNVGKASEFIEDIARFVQNSTDLYTNRSKPHITSQRSNFAQDLRRDEQSSNLIPEDYKNLQQALEDRILTPQELNSLAPGPYGLYYHLINPNGKNIASAVQVIKVKPYQVTAKPDTVKVEIPVQLPCPKIEQDRSLERAVQDINVQREERKGSNTWKWVAGIGAGAVIGYLIYQATNDDINITINNENNQQLPPGWGHDRDDQHDGVENP